MALQNRNANSTNYLIIIVVDKWGNRIYSKEDMDDTKSMLRAIINGQSAMKEELLGEIRKVDQKVDGVREDLKGLESRLTKRIDKIGLQVASLEDDAPTREELDDLDSRVHRLEQLTPSV